MRITTYKEAIIPCDQGTLRQTIRTSVQRMDKFAGKQDKTGHYPVKIKNPAIPRTVFRQKP